MVYIKSAEMDERISIFRVAIRPVGLSLGRLSVFATVKRSEIKSTGFMVDDNY